MLRSLVATLLVLIACARPEPRALTIDPIDCAELRVDGVCEVLEGKTLGLWVHGPRTKLRAFVEDEEIPLREGNRDATGFVVRIELPQKIGTLALRGESVAGRVVLARHAAPPALVEARALRRAHEFDRAEAVLQPLLASANPAERARALGLSGRILLSRERIPEAVETLGRAIAADERAGLLTCASADRLALGDTLYRHRNALGPARAVLSAVDSRVLDHRPWADYHLGAIASATGNAREALSHLEQARTHARLFALPELSVDATDIIATLYAALGRYEQAVSLIEANPTSDDADPCVRLTHLVNVGWVRYLAAAAGERPFDDSASLEAIGLSEGACPDAWLRDNARLNIALEKAARGDNAAALAWLEQPSSTGAPGYVIEAYRAELRAALRLGAGDHVGALRDYDALLRQAGGTAPLSVRYRAQLGRGRVLRASNQHEAALEAFTRAEGLLERIERLVPLGDMHGAFLSSHQDASTEHVDLLHSLGRTEDALETARRARRRLLSAFTRWGRLAQLDPGTRARWEARIGEFRAARDAAEAHAARAWSVPKDERTAFDERGTQLAADVERSFDEAMASVGDVTSSTLPQLREGEAMLIVHPVRDGLLALFAFEDRIEPTILAASDLRDPARLAQALVVPRADSFTRVRVLRVLSGGAFDDVAVHALPLGEGVLLSQVPVVYALDLASAEPHVLNSPEPSLLVSDPRSDLPLAAQEAAQVATVLSSRSTLSHLAGASASLPALRTHLAAAHWFHYAGHAESSRHGMLESALSLAGGAMFTLSDVLVLPRVPELVVLSACESSRTFVTGKNQGVLATLGLAQAFVLAGSHAVLATRSVVSDSAASAMSRALYGDSFRGQLTPGEVQRAALSLRETHPAEWDLYRLVVP